MEGVDRIEIRARIREAKYLAQQGYIEEAFSVIGELILLLVDLSEKREAD